MHVCMCAYMLGCRCVFIKMLLLSVTLLIESANPGSTINSTVLTFPTYMGIVTLYIVENSYLAVLCTNKSFFFCQSFTSALTVWSWCM